MEHVVGPQEAVEGICIGADDDMEMRRKDIADAIAAVDQGEGVIILTDLFGGTPSNLAISLMKSENVEVIAGVNLPMLIRLEGARKAMTRPRRGRRRARGGPQIYLGRVRNPRARRRLERLLARRSRSPTSRGLHARASAKFVNVAAGLAAKVEVEKDGNRVVRHLDHGPDDARRGDGRQHHHPLRRRRLRRGDGGACRRWSKSGSARTDASPDHLLFQRRPSSASARCATRRRARPKGCSWPKGCASSPRRATAAACPRSSLTRQPAASIRWPPRSSPRPRPQGADVIETTPDILSKMSGKDNPQAILGAYRQPDTVARARSTAPRRRCGSSPRRCAIRAISAPSCAPATRPARAG